MSFELGVSLLGSAVDFGKKVEKGVSKAQRSGMRKTGGALRKTFKKLVSFRGAVAPIGQLGTRTGLFKKLIKLKTFQYSNKTWGASLKVKKPRDFVFRLQENGFRLAGGRMVAARGPGQATLAKHADEIPALIERFTADAMRVI